MGVGNYFTNVLTPNIPQTNPAFEVIALYQATDAFAASESGSLDSPTMPPIPADPPSLKYVTGPDFGYGGEFDLDEDDNVGFVSYGCAFDPDFDGVCSKYENTKVISCDVGGGQTRNYDLPVTPSFQFPGNDVAGGWTRGATTGPISPFTGSPGWRCSGSCESASRCVRSGQS